MNGRNARFNIIGTLIVLQAIIGVAWQANAAGANGSGAVDTHFLSPGDSLERELKPGDVHTYGVDLGTGESAFIVFKQMGVDVVVEIRNADGTLIASVDSPNGRNGDEPVLLDFGERARFELRVRSIDASQPAGKYGVRYAWRRDAQETEAVVNTSRQWLANASVQIPASGTVPDERPLPALSRWLGGVSVVGIGEATHGSRELGNLRLSLTKLLIEHYGFRVVAIEASADKYRALTRYIAGQTSRPSPSLPGPGWIWIGQRAQRELIEWVRAWNSSHAAKRVRIVGIDANDNAIARAELTRFIANRYRGAELSKAWPNAAAELAAADEQSFVFGDSRVDLATWKLLAQLAADRDSNAAPWRDAPAGRRADAAEALSILTEFAAFNSDGDIGDVPQSRDVYMARRVLCAVGRDGAKEKAIYWAHNAHVIHPKGSTRIAGSVLRAALGTAYVAIATTFGEGKFLAEIPNDAEDRLAISGVPMAAPGTVEGMLASVRPAGSLALWRPDLTDAEVPTWFHVPRRMHWVGGLYRPDANPAEASQPYMLMSDFDGVAYLPLVDAEKVIPQPRIPARTRAKAP